MQNSTIYYYFKNKNVVYKDILEKSLGELIDILESAVQEGRDPIDRFRKYINSFTDFLSHKTETAYLILQIKYFEDPDLTHLTKRFWLKHAQIVEGFLREGVEEGVFKPINTRLLSVLIRGMLVWYFMSSPITDLFPGMEDHKRRYDGRIADEILNVLQQGIAKQ